jgi:hypothetical protein
MGVCDVLSPSPPSERKYIPHNSEFRQGWNQQSG